MASDDARRARLEAAAAQLEAEHERECTFRPALSAHPARLSDQENQNPDAEVSLTFLSTDSNLTTSAPLFGSSSLTSMVLAMSRGCSQGGDLLITV